MPYVIALVALVMAYDWLDKKLQTTGLGWKGLGFIAGAVVLLFAMLRWAARRQAAIAAQPAPHSFARKLGKPVLIRYRDPDGYETERVVRVDQVFGDDPTAGITHIRGHCQMRDDIRTFRTDRVQLAAHPKTGEVISDLSLYLLGRPSPPPPPPVIADEAEVAGDRIPAFHRAVPRTEVIIRYRDAAGATSERKVIIERIFAETAKSPITHLRGYCYLERGQTVFRCQRVLSALDGDTRQALNLAEVLLTRRKGESSVGFEPTPKFLLKESAE